MEYTIERSGYNVLVKLTLSAAEWEDAIERAYQKTKSKYRIMGFRPGKAPRKLIERNYGEGIFLEDAFHDCFPKVFGEVCEKENLQTVGTPDVDIEDIGDTGVTFAVRVVVRPEVKLGEYKGLSVECPKYTVSADDVKRDIDLALERGSRMIEVKDRAAAMGDHATIDYSGSVDGEKFEGGTAENHNLELGSNSFIPGFEAQVVGMNIGEERDINVSFPKEYHAEHLAGKPAVFKVLLRSLKQKELPKLDDEFAKDLGFDTLEEYRADVKKGLEDKAAQRTEVESENRLLDAVTKNTEIDIPEVMVEEQIDRFAEDFEYRLKYQGMKMDDYFKYTGSTLEQFRESRRAEAQNAVKVRLVIEEIIEKEALRVEDEDVEKKLAEIAEKQGKSVEDIKKQIGKNMGYLYNDIIMDKVLTLLKTSNTIVEEKPKKAEKAKKAEAEPASEAADKPAKKAKKKD